MGKVLVKELETNLWVMPVAEPTRTEVLTSAGGTKCVEGDLVFSGAMFEVDFEEGIYAKLAASRHKAPNLPYDGDDDL